VALRKRGKLYLGWLSISHAAQRNALSATVSPSLLPVLPQVLARVRQLFDLDCDPYAVQEQLATLKEVHADLPLPGIRLPGSFDPFETCIRAVLGQQVTVKGARTLAARLAAAFGEKVATPFEELRCSFPLPETVCSLEPPIADRLGPLGIIGARARTILALAQGIASGEFSLASSANPAQVMERLLKLPGMGAWTVQYIAMRVLGWPDALLASDYGVKKALSALPWRDALKLSESWSPWRSYATVSLWYSLAGGAGAVDKGDRL
jgi:AraC family transcriptional regulator of adaptative response / DNA-3-methyladenine glycosylase II